MRMGVMKKKLPLKFANLRLNTTTICEGFCFYRRYFYRVDLTILT